jgi:hypothetical protein
MKSKPPANEMLALLLAAFCHDVANDGFVTMSSIDALYQSQSVYESHSVLVASCFIGKLQFFQTDRSSWELFVDLILATDMSKHFALIQGLAEHIVNFEDVGFRKLFLKMLLKSADVSGGC